MKTKIIPLLAAITATLSGCATVQNTKEINKTTEAYIERQLLNQRTLTTNSSVFEVVEGFTVSQEPLAAKPLSPSEILPEEFQKTASLGIQTPVSISEVLARISSLTGYRIVIEPDISGSSTGNLSGRRGLTSQTTPSLLGGAQSLPPIGAVGQSALPPLPNFSEPTMPPPVALPTLSATNEGSELFLPSFIYSGTLAGMLDEATARLNLSWRWTGNRVEVFKYETRVFRFDALDVNMTSRATVDTKTKGSSGGGVGSGGGGGGVEGTSGQSTSVDFKLEVWKEVEEVVKAILSDRGEVTIASNSGRIIVRDTPFVLDRVERQIKQLNDFYSRRVYIQVEVYAVSRGDEQSNSADWMVAWQKSAQDIGLSFATPNTGAPEGSSFLITAPAGSKFDGSALAVTALTRSSNAVRLNTASVTVSNGRSIPLNISRTRSFIESYSTTVTNETVTEAIKPGTISEGFALNITPRILENNEVILNYAIDLSDIERIDEFTTPSGSAAVQLPQRLQRSFLQDARLSSGQTLVLTGFEQADANFQTDGMVPRAWFLGGQRAANNSSRTIVIIMSVKVLQN